MHVHVCRGISNRMGSVNQLDFILFIVYAHLVAVEISVIMVVFVAVLFHVMVMFIVNRIFFIILSVVHLLLVTLAHVFILRRANVTAEVFAPECGGQSLARIDG